MQKRAKLRLAAIFAIILLESIQFVRQSQLLKNFHFPLEYADGIVNKKTSNISLNNTTEKGTQDAYLTMYGEHRVKPALEKLPKWLIDYFAWHQKQIQNSNKSTKYLVLACPKGDRCGGLSDRMRALPFMLFIGSRANRVLCIYWEKPFGLESFLQPPKGGMDWRCPAEFDSKVKNVNYVIPFSPASKKEGDVGNRVAEYTLEKLSLMSDKYVAIKLFSQDFHNINKGNHVFNIYSYNQTVPATGKWFHIELMEHIFRAMFEPVVQIAQKINETMTKLGLVENNYTSVHVRARYPVQRLQRSIGNKVNDNDLGIKDAVFEGDYKKYLIDVANNALECGVLLDKDKKLFFASDSVDLVKFVNQNPTELTINKHDRENISYQPLSIHSGREINAHLESEKPDSTPKASDYYSIFEDILIIGGSSCVTHGVGSFGAFGAGLIGNKCRSVHRKYQGSPTTCPNDLSPKLFVPIIDDDLIFGERLQDFASSERLNLGPGYELYVPVSR